MKTCLLCLFLLISRLSPGQAIDNLPSFRNSGSGKSVRFRYDNDFFTATDRYYTQGINLEITHPSFQGFFLEKILLHPITGRSEYGISFQHNAYTPTSIRHNEIILDDRPFAACLFLNTFRVVTDTLRRRRMSATISLGLLGQGAGGKEMQETIHRWLNNIEPLGWSHQVRNDLILNYQVNYEQGIYHRRYLLLSSYFSGRAGTLSDKLGGGFTLMTGLFDNPYSPEKPGRKVQLYLYTNPVVQAIGYDATLQGGLFDRESPYVLPAAAIDRMVFQNNAGIVLRFGKVYLEYFQSVLTKEFSTGVLHRWGGIQFGAAF